MNHSESKKRRTHVALRDLFWLVLAAALALGWWRDRGDLTEKNQQLTVENIHLKWRLYAGTSNWRDDEIVPIANNTATGPVEIED